jgi:chromosome segregation ATPase
MVNEQLTIIAAIVASTFTILASIIASLTILYRGIGRLEGRIGGVEGRMTGLEGRMTNLENRMAGLEDRITSLENRVTSLENRVISLENRVARLEERINVIERRMDAFMLFGGSLLGVLTGRNLIDIPSANFLASILSFGVGGGRSKYYTQEEYEKLRSILSKKMEEITWDDVRELKRIIGLIEREVYEEHKIDLVDTLMRVKFITAMYEGYLFVKTHGRREGEAKG